MVKINKKFNAKALFPNVCSPTLVIQSQVNTLRSKNGYHPSIEKQFSDVWSIKVLLLSYAKYYGVAKLQSVNN